MSQPASGDFRCRRTSIRSRLWIHGRDEYMAIKVGDVLIAEEDGCFWPLGDSPRTPQRLALEAKVVWVSSKRLRVKLPEASVTLDGRPVNLPPIRRDLNRFEDRMAWHSLTIEPLEPSEWPNRPFYPKIEGRWATARTATYYTLESWRAYCGAFLDGAPFEKVVSDVPMPPTGLRAYAKLLGIDPSAGRAQVMAAFRERVKSVHPDAGGDPAAFRLLIEARDALLAVRED